MKKLILLAGMLAMCAGLANRAEAFTTQYDRGFSTATVVGVKCSTGTAEQLDIKASPDRLDSYQRSTIRVMNHDAADAIYLGYSASVSSDTASDFLGVRISADGGNAVFQLSRHIPLYCIAADAAGAAGVRVSLEEFGY